MSQILTALTRGLEFTGQLAPDLTAFLTHHGFPKTAQHCLQVGEEARRLAARFGADQEAAQQSGWLHDVSAVFPSRERLDAARALDIEILPEEEAFPLILHQKLSVVLAEEIFGVENQAILSAVGCHTTLKAKASTLDKVVFVADKIAWDQPGEPPYLKAVREGLAHSLEAGALAYINFLWERRDTLKVVHPWMREAREELKGKAKG